MPSELTRSVSHTSDDIETCTTWEIAMQDFFKFILLWSVLASPATQKSGPPLGQVLYDQTYQQIRESFRDPVLRFLMFHG